MSALHLACWIYESDMLRLLLTADVNIEVVGRNQNALRCQLTALHQAIIDQQINNVRTLIKYGAVARSVKIITEDDDDPDSIERKNEIKKLLRVGEKG